MLIHADDSVLQPVLAFERKLNVKVIVALDFLALNSPGIHWAGQGNGLGKASQPLLAIQNQALRVVRNIFSGDGVTLKASAKY